MVGLQRGWSTPLGWLLGLVVALCIVAGLAAPARAAASVYAVNSTTDATDATPGDGMCADAGGKCTLRAAVQEANEHPNDPTGPDEITIPPGTYTLAIAGANEDASAKESDLDITDNVKITGAGKDSTTIDGDKAYRAFENIWKTVEISGLTIKNGKAGTGGAFFNGGPPSAAKVTFNNVRFTANEALTGGGAIYNQGQITAIDSEFTNNKALINYGGAITQYSQAAILSFTRTSFEGNTAAHSGGAIYMSYGTLVLKAASFTGNRAVAEAGAEGAGGGGVYIYGVHATIDDTTFAGNEAKGLGGGIQLVAEDIVRRPSKITNSTFSGNKAASGGGIYSYEHGTILTHVTVANNTGGGIGAHYGLVSSKSSIFARNGPQNCSGSLISQGHNLSNDATCFAPGGTDSTGTDPKLGELADNGGPTETLALQDGSPAIDAADNTNAPAVDQRGVSRPQDGDGDGQALHDIGAFETDAMRATTTTLARTTGSATSAYGDSLTFTATVTANGGNPNGVGTVDFKDGSAVTCDDVPLSGSTATCSPSLNAGSYNLTAVYSGTSSGSPQFQGSTSAALSQTVNKAAATTTVTCGAGPFIFNGSAHEPCSAKVTGPGGLDQSLPVNYTDNVNAGTATARASYAGNDNYSTSTGSKDFIIEKADATIDVQGYEGTYDGTAHGATGTAKGVGGADLSGLLDLGDSFTNVLGGTANWSFAGNDNYKSANGTAQIVIGKKELLVNAKGQSTVYGDEHLPPTYELSGFVSNEDKDSAGISGAPECSILGSTGSNIGEYSDAIVCAPGTLSAANYGFDAGSKGKLTITKRPITVTAVSDTKAYDGTISSGKTPTVTGGIVSGDQAHFGQAFDTKNAGQNKRLTPSGSVNDNNGGNNYQLNFADNTNGEITAEELTASFTAEDKVYDGNDSATVLTRSVNGEISGDDVNLSGGTARFNDKNVANGKTVTLTGASLAGADKGNYNLTSVSTTTANITAKDLTASFTADNKVYDGNDSANIAIRTLRGVVGNEDVSLDGGTAKFNDKNVADGKTVSATGFTLAGNAKDNYTLKAGPWTTNAGIVPAPLTVTAANQSKKLGDPNPTFTVSYSGFVHGEDNSVLGGTLTFATNVPSPEQAGTWDITPGGLTSSNYSITFVKGTLTITSITYKFDGFRSPVDNPGTGSTPVFNSAKAGQSIPVKFGLGGNQGLNIMAAGYPKVTSVNCVSSATVDPIEEYAASTANGGLTYDVTANQYSYVWKTQSTYASKCYKFDLQLTDGTSHVAYFKFLK